MTCRGTIRAWLGAVLPAVLAVLAGGCEAPQAKPATILVPIAFPGYAPFDVDARVARPVGADLLRADDVDSLATVSYFGRADLFVTGGRRTGGDRMLAAVKERLGRLAPRLAEEGAEVSPPRPARGDEAPPAAPAPLVDRLDVVGDPARLVEAGISPADFARLLREPAMAPATLPSTQPATEPGAKAKDPRHAREAQAAQAAQAARMADAARKMEETLVPLSGGRTARVGDLATVRVVRERSYIVRRYR